MRDSRWIGRWTAAMAGVFVASAALGADGAIALVSYGSSLYRVSDGLLQEFPGQPGEIVGMTVTPDGVSVAGCEAGDVIACESGGPRIWRVDHARAGVPVLVEVGSQALGTDIAFVDGRMFAVSPDAIIQEFDLQTFAPLGDPIDLERNGADVGGLSFDGDASWYLTNQATNRLIRLDDPPTPGSWTVVGDAGVGFGKSDLEWFRGELWAGLRSPANDTGHLIVGTFDTLTGMFMPAWTVRPTPSSAPVGLAMLEPCGPDLSNPFGTLDFSDVFAFLVAFGNAEPAADLAEPFGVYDFSDVFAFLTAFGGGCP